jgi:hypothetical protein
VRKDLIKRLEQQEARWAPRKECIIVWVSGKDKEQPNSPAVEERIVADQGPPWGPVCERERIPPDPDEQI